MPEPNNVTARQKVFFCLSVLIAAGYGLLYYRYELGVSPFHFSARLPGVDLVVLLVTVIFPLALGILLGVLSGRLKWFVLPAYPVVVALSLF